MIITVGVRSRVERIRVWDLRNQEVRVFEVALQ